MTFCVICRCKSLKKLSKDIIVDKIGNPPVLLSELLLQITSNLEYQFVETEICNKCTNKIACYYKSIQKAEEIKLKILALLQNQIKVEMDDYQADGGEDEGLIESSEIVYTLDYDHDHDHEFSVEDNDVNKLSQNSIFLQEFCSEEDDSEVEFESIISKDKDISNESEQVKRNTEKMQTEFYSLKGIRKAKSRKIISVRKKQKEDELNNIDKRNNGEKENTATTAENQGKMGAKKNSTDCSSSKGVFMYSLGRVGEPMGIRCELCDRVFKYSRTFHAHKKYKDFAGYVCEICGITCLTKVGIKDHAKVHKPDKEFQCEICDAQFHRKLLYQQHMAYHTDERPFQCNVCSKSFAHRIALKVHSKIHTNDYRHIECDFCDKKFRSLTHKRRHMPLHTGEKPFTCYICGNRFSQADNMRAHIKLLHSGKFQKDVTTKTLNCQKCSIECNNLLEYEKHMKSCI